MRWVTMYICKTPREMRNRSWSRMERSIPALIIEPEAEQPDIRKPQGGIDMGRTLGKIIFATLALLTVAIPLAAQTASSGTVIGAVTDPSGAIIPGVTIELK